MGRSCKSKDWLPVKVLELPLTYCIVPVLIKHYLLKVRFLFR